MSDISILTLALLLLHWGLIIGFTVRVIMRRRPVGVSLAWIAIIFSVPLLGVLTYLAIGENRISEQYVRRARAIRAEYVQWQKSLDEQAIIDHSDLYAEASPLLNQARSVSGFPALPGNRLKLIEDFQSVFRSIIDDIDRCKRTCHLEFYIWHPGGLADELQDALLRAVKRGVTCRVLVDAFGSKGFLASPSTRVMREAGIEVQDALPAGILYMFLSRADLRNHRKLIVIDGEIAYTGSQNLVDPRNFKQDAGVGQWIDAMVRIDGPAVEALAGSFIQDWEVATGVGLDRLRSNSDIRPLPTTGTVPVQAVPSGPGWMPMAIHQLLLTTLYAARRELIITTPYFVPDESLLSALVSAAHKGVDVRLILPERNDSLLVHYSSRSYYADLLAAGVHIHCFQGGLLHTKSISVDGELCLFGSVNMDMRSIWINFELSLLVYDREFTRELRQMQLNYISRSVAIDSHDWQRRPRWEHFIENGVRLASPLL